ncbi:hypothetical protein ACFOWB_24595 [Chenggangzhangella methanolivorans]|uniref:hypothetical protein n=1 Tax=Chenggangzhangella methanolivorans TaxID=1437009 RepID=UPI0036142F73
MTENTSQHQGASGRVCYLHIGPHKTGTTSIQNALFTHALRLEAIGLSYPTLSGDKPGRQRRNHTPLARLGVMRAEDLKSAPFWSELSEKIAATSHSIIVSTEHFADALRDPARFRKTIDFFHDHGFRIVVVAYFRDQPGWLNSWYTQDQRNFMSRQSFPEFLDRAFETGLVDPWAILRRFIDDERIEVRVVSFEQAIKKGLAKSFLDAIGAPADFEIPEPQASNPNLGVKGVYAAQEIMRRVGFRVRSMPNYPELYESFKVMMKGRDWEKSAYVGVSPDDERRIRDRYRESNDAFAQEWFGADWASVCPPRPMTQREFDFETAGEDDQSDVLEVIETMVALIQGAPGDLPAGKLKKGPKGGKGGGKNKGAAAKLAAGEPEKTGPGKLGAGKAGPGKKGQGKKGPGKPGGGPKGEGKKQGPKKPATPVVI